jgi:hypothetical protein
MCGRVKLLFGEQNCWVLTSKSATAVIATRLRTLLQCRPRTFWGNMACQKEDVLTVKQDEDRNPKKLSVIRHAVCQTDEMMNASRT